MAKRAANATRVYYDIYDWSGVLNAVTANVNQENPVVTALSDTGPRRLVANYDHDTAMNGFADTADDNFDERVHSFLGTTVDYHEGVFWEGTTTEGGIVWESLKRLTDQPRSAAVGGALLLNVSSAGSGHLARGVVLRSATVTGIGNGTGQNLGATTAGVITVATFRVLSGTFTSITMRIEESQNDGGADPYAAIAALDPGAITTASVVRTTTTGATEAWKRLAVTAFVGTNAVILVTLTTEANTG